MAACHDVSTARDVLTRAESFRSAHWMRADGRSTLIATERDHLVVQCGMGQGVRHVRIDVADAPQLRDVLPDGVL